MYGIYVFGLIALVVSLITVIGGSEGGARVKRVKADGGLTQEPSQALDDPVPAIVDLVSPAAPHVFLSRLVKEHLELGMAIPGKGKGRRESMDADLYQPVIMEINGGGFVQQWTSYGEMMMKYLGKPGLDYPLLPAVPYTNFYCDEQPYPGYFADMETRCQVWHYCDIDGRQASFLCPNGTVFSQGVMSCDWWFNVRCDLSPKLYPLNARLYRRRRKHAKRTKPKPHRVIDKQFLDEFLL